MSRTCSLSILVLSIVIPSVLADERPSDHELIQGKWRFLDGNSDQPRAKGEPEAPTFEFIGTEAHMDRHDGFRTDGTFALDEAKTPRWINLTSHGIVTRGIYKLDGDRLVVCFGSGNKRPADFTATDVQSLYRLARIHAPLQPTSATSQSTSIPSSLPAPK